MISKIFPLFLFSTLSHADPEYRNTSTALNLKSNSYCMDGFGVIQNNNGCQEVSLIRDDGDMTWTAQCINKQIGEDNPIINTAYAFVPAGYTATDNRYIGFTRMCADGSFTLLRAPLLQ